MLAPEQEEKIANALKQGKRIVDLHPQQAEVYDDPSKIRIVCAGSGWGKTFLAILIIIQCVFLNPGTLSVIFSPTDKQGERNIYDTFKQIWNLLKTYDRYFKQFDTPEKDANFFADGEIVFKVPYKNKLVETKVLLLSGYNDKRIRGIRITGVKVYDELSFIDNNEKLWITAKGRLSGKAKTVVISTPPENYDLLYKLVQQGQPFNEDGTPNKDKKEDIRSWVFKTLDNPTDENIKTIVKEAAESMAPEDFEREFEAKWKKVGGNLCKYFKREKNVVDWDIIKDKTICISSDFNISCMTSIAFVVLTKQEIKERILDKGLNINNTLKYENLQDEVMYVFKDWKYENVDTLVPELCENITNYLLEIGYDSSHYSLKWYGDPHGIARNVNATRNAEGRISNSWSEIKLYFPNVNLYVDKFEEQMNRVTNFNSKVRNYLDQTGILINKNCENLIKDIESIRKSADGKGIDKSREKKPHYIGHLFDCISYAVSYRWNVKNNRVSRISFIEI
ncbi:MAG: terminase family protein [Ignavibacteria bacterium]|nr:terminase family protein [Ignavibacteria bacterium]